MRVQNQSNGYHIEHVHDLVFPGDLSAKGELCMIYDCFLDDSKDHRQEYVYTCAGFVGPRHAWEKMRVEWDAVLKKDGLEYWKTSESKGLEGQFAKYQGLPRERVNPLISDIRGRLMNVVNKHSRIRGIAVSIPVEVYAEVMAHPSAKLVFGEKDLYDRAFEGVITMAAHAVTDGYVGYVHDDGQDFDHLRSVYNSYTKKLPTISRRMAGFLPLDDKKHPPLQAADMIANSVMGNHRDMLNSIPINRSEVAFIQKSNFYTWDKEFGLQALRVELEENNLPVPDDLIEATKHKWPIP